MLTKIKYKSDSVNGVDKIIEIYLPCKPDIGDCIWVEEIDKKLEVMHITIVGRTAQNRNMKRPALMLTARLVQN